MSNFSANIQAILDTSKIDAAKMEILPCSYEISTMLNDLFNMLVIKANSKNLQLIFEIDPEIPSEYYGDDVRIKQVLVNLLNNAVKYTDEGTITLQVSCTVEGTNGILHFKVKDTGIGIREEDFDKLFEKNQTSWSGNIDAFTTERDEHGKIQITSLIECRYTSKGSVSCYDPNDYYRNNGGDFYTWNGLWKIKRKLEIPLYLITFSRDVNFREELGVTEIIDFNKENGVIYKESVKPGMRVMHSSAELMEWMCWQK